MAGGAAHGGERGGHRRADRRLDHRRARSALGLPRADAHVPPGRWAGRHGPHARPLRTVAALAVDEARRARAHARAARQRGARDAREEAGPRTIADLLPSATASSSTSCACSARRPVAEPLVWSEDVRPEWIDYNGHLSEAYYVLVFGHATDEVMAGLGMTAAVPRRHRDVAVHARGARPLPRPGVRRKRGWRCGTSVIGVTGKLLWLWHEMWCDGRLRATEEVLAVHVDTTRSAVPARFPGSCVAPPRRCGCRRPNTRLAVSRSCEVTARGSCPDSVEQRAVMETTRAFVHRELVPHEDEVERSGGTRSRSCCIACGTGRSGPASTPPTCPTTSAVAAWTPLSLDADGARARPHRLRAADARRRPAVPDPAGLRRRPTGELPAAGGGRRAHRVPCDDRAGGGLRPAWHAHPRGPRRRRLGDHRDQALHQPRRRVRLRDPVRHHRRQAARPTRRAGRRSPPSSSTSTRPGSPCCPATAASRTAATATPSSSSTAAGCRASAVLGEVGRGFEVANAWLGTTRLQVAASCLGRARRALDLAAAHAATRRQFGRPIGRNQGVAFKLADMSIALESATWLTWRAAWLVDTAGSRRPGRESRDRDGQARRPPRCSRWSPTRRCRSTAAWV